MAKKEKSIQDKLNQRHVYAIKCAERGDYMPLMQVCRETRKAIRQVSLVTQCNAREWQDATIAYYTELLHYLEDKITDSAAFETYMRSAQHINEVH